jgi:hypothetical protein
VTNNLCGAKCFRTTSDIRRARFRTLVIIVSVLSITSLSTLVLGGGTAEAAPRTWSIGPSPAPVPSNDILNGVSCVSSTNCLAVGSYVGGSDDDNQALADAWNGTGWSALSTPINNYSLSGVSCAGPTTYCMAVGYEVANQEWFDTFTEFWNGSELSVIPSPDPGESNSLDSVSCVSPTDCVAVGSQYIAQVNLGIQTLAESWNGSVWSVMPTPTLAGPANNILVSVSCSSANSCTSVGYSKGEQSMTGKPIYTALIESWNGSTWSVDRNPKGINHGQLESVSCVSSTECKAAGFFRSHDTLIASWNGRMWSIEPTPSNGTDRLSGISCTSSKSCTAVGQVNESPYVQTLIESWNGKDWQITPSPNVADTDNWLNAITCTNTNRCLAVGDDDESINSTMLVEIGT